MKPWRNVPVRDFIVDSFKRPTAFQNDANAAAYGEFLGRRRKTSTAVMVLFHGSARASAAALSWTISRRGRAQSRRRTGAHEDRDDQPAVVRLRQERGCLEAYASASAVVARTREALNAAGPSSLRDC